jgi:hypothetical protein
MWRVAVYAQETPGRRGRDRLDRQVTRLATGVARRPGWWHVATYAFDAGWRPGLSRLLADAPGRFDIVAVDGYRRISADRHERDAIFAHLKAVGVATALLRPSAARQLVTVATEVALIDLIDGAMR